MNNTNRALNRFFIFLVGLLLFIVGVAALAFAVLPDIQSGWKKTAPTVRDTASGWFAAAHIPDTEVSWWWIAVLAVLVLLIVLLLVFIFRQGHGHTSKFISTTPNGHGRTIIDSKVAEQLVQDALTDHPALVSSHVSTYLVKKTPVLKVSATARRGVSPSDVIATAETALTSLDQLVGQHVLASVQIGGGFRARTAKTTRLQ